MEPVIKSRQRRFKRLILRISPQIPNETVIQSRLIQAVAVMGLFVVVLALFTLVYRDYTVASSESWQQVTYRVMDSMLPFQDRFRDTHERYAVGVFDRTQGDATLTRMIDWRPSVTDSNRYVVHVIGNNAFKVIATSTDGRSLCRLYPSKQHCFNLDTYLQRGL